MKDEAVDNDLVVVDTGCGHNGEAALLADFSRQSPGGGVVYELQGPVQIGFPHSVATDIYRHATYRKPQGFDGSITTYIDNGKAHDLCPALRFAFHFAIEFARSALSEIYWTGNGR